MRHSGSGVLLDAPRSEDNHDVLLTNCRHISASKEGMVGVNVDIRKFVKNDP